MTEQGYQSHLNILTAVSLGKRLLGHGEFLLLNVYGLYFGEDQRRHGGVKKTTWKLRVERPLIVTDNVVRGLDSPGQRGKISYEPILNILQAKTGELSGLVKELEAAAA